MQHRAKKTVLAALLALACLGGCQTAPQPESKPSAPAGPMREGYQRPRNPYFLPRPILVFESAEMQRLVTADSSGPAWYDERNDYRLTTQSGYQTRTFESVYTQTYDRQYQHGGSVRDHYSRWTRSGSVKEAVR